MIGHAADLAEASFFGPHDAAHVLIKLLVSFASDRKLSILRAKNDMVIETGKSARHRLRFLQGR